jgi:hypothetical protein
LPEKKSNAARPSNYEKKNIRETRLRNKEMEEHLYRRNEEKEKQEGETRKNM